MTGAAAVVVVNPTKVDDPYAARAWLADAARRCGVPEPRWVETTPEDPGRGMAERAVADGAGLVLAWGGDGTVRACAAGLRGTDVPLGLLPAGTGNLLARNLSVPLDLDDAVAVAFTGADRRLDVLEVDVDGVTEVGTVIAGLGVDADMMTAPEGLKAAAGPAAYAAGLAKGLLRRRPRVAVAVDGGAPHWLTAGTVLVANVGGLVAGMDVAPQARPDDGRLDVVVLRLRSPLDLVRTGVALVRRRTPPSGAWTASGRSVLVVAGHAVGRQVDGDVLREGTRLSAVVAPDALVVRVPRPGAD